VCRAWCKSTRRAWGLPSTMRCDLLAPVSRALPLLDIFINWSVHFFSQSLDSDNNIVKFTSRQSTYFARMYSPGGGNAQFCCSRYNKMLSQLREISKSRNNVTISCYSHAVCSWCSICYIWIALCEQLFYGSVHLIRRWDGIVYTSVLCSLTLFSFKNWFCLKFTFLKNCFTCTIVQISLYINKCTFVCWSTKYTFFIKCRK